MQVKLKALVRILNPGGLLNSGLIPQINGVIQWLRGPNFELFWPPPTYSGQTWTFQVPPTFCPRGHFQNLSPWKNPVLHWVHSNSFYLLKKFQIIRIFILAEIKPKGYKHVYKFAVIDWNPSFKFNFPFFVHVDIWWTTTYLTWTIVDIWPPTTYLLLST